MNPDFSRIFWRWEQIFEFVLFRYLWSAHHKFHQYFSVLRTQFSYWSIKVFFLSFKNQNKYFIKFGDKIGKKLVKICGEPIIICYCFFVRNHKICWKFVEIISELIVGSGEKNNDSYKKISNILNHTDNVQTFCTF